MLDRVEHRPEDIELEVQNGQGAFLARAGGAPAPRNLESVFDVARGLADAGFVDIEITPTHEAAAGMHSAIVKARKPAA